MRALVQLPYIKNFSMKDCNLIDGSKNLIAFKGSKRELETHFNPLADIIAAQDTALCTKIQKGTKIQK